MSMEKATVAFLSCALLWANAAVTAGAAQVIAQVRVAAANGEAHINRDVSVVLWLLPLNDRGASRPTAQNELPHPQLIQKNKTFEPHIVAVQVGAEVDFPNHDPFFHNVFSLFNGKRFDLGLYESGSTRGVHFDRAGICYIFCNIHPQMSAVVVVVDTPYFAVSNSRGEVAIPHVPSGRYQLNLWEEHCAPKTLQDLSREVTVAESGTTLANIHLQESDVPVTAHLNKYGKPYDPDAFSSPLYEKP